SLEIKPESRAGRRSVAPPALLGPHALGVVSFLYAPRTGGAYDSHHRTAGIAGRIRRRGSRVAARGARAGAAEAAERRVVASENSIRLTRGAAANQNKIAAYFHSDSY